MYNMKQREVILGRVFTFKLDSFTSNKSKWNDGSGWGCRTGNQSLKCFFIWLAFLGKYEHCFTVWSAHVMYDMKQREVVLGRVFNFKLDSFTSNINKKNDHSGWGCGTRNQSLNYLFIQLAFLGKYEHHFTI
jgi:hypothetical protein